MQRFTVAVAFSIKSRKTFVKVKVDYPNTFIYLHKTLLFDFYIFHKD